MAGSKLPRRKRCPSCWCLFRPRPRAGSRQRFCTASACQRERHRRACARWHEENPDYNRRARLREKVAPAEKATPAPELHADPLVQLDLEAVRPELALAGVVALEEALRAHREWSRAAFEPAKAGARRGLPGSVRGPP